MKNKKIDPMEILRSIRKIVVTPKGGPQGTPKGRRGYDRKREKQNSRRENW